METWKLSGWNMKRFHKRRQVVLTHSIKAPSLPQHQPLRLAFSRFGFGLFDFFLIPLPFTPSLVTHDRCEGTSSPLSPGWTRLMDKDALSESASDLRCSVLGSAACTSQPRRVDCNKEQMCYLETFFFFFLSVLLLFWQD